MSVQSIIDNILKLSENPTAFDNYMFELSATYVTMLTPDQLLSILIESCSNVQYHQTDFPGYNKLRSDIFEKYPQLISRLMCYECF
jgi:aspartate/methionine/tyrosine aminotransferase